MEEPLISDSESRSVRSDSVTLKIVPEDVLSKEGNVIFNAYYRFLSKYHKWVVVFWFLVFGISAMFAKTFMTLAVDALQAPPGTRAAIDQDEFITLFPEKAQEVPVIILAESLQKEDLRESKDLAKFTFAILDEVKEHDKSEGNVLGNMSYYLYDGTLLDDVKKPFMSNNNHATFMTFLLNSTRDTSTRKAFVAWLGDAVDKLNPDPSRYDIGLTGMDQLATTVTDTATSQMEKTDSFSIPVAMALLGYMVSSWRLLGLGLFNMGLSIVTGFAVMVFLVKQVNIGHPDSTCPQLMQGLSLSLSIDYCLFICRRFKDEIDGLKSRNHPDQAQCPNWSIALCRSMLYAGHVVVMSGITIVVVFFGFTMLPAEQVKVDGIGCAVGVLICMAVALFNTPALIMTFPGFFTKFCDGSQGQKSGWFSCCSFPCFGGNRTRDESDYNSVSSFYDDEAEMEMASHALGDDDSTEDGIHERNDGKPHPMYQSKRFHFTKFVTKWPNNVLSILFLYICVLPLAFQAVRININEDILAALPRGSAVSDRLDAMSKEFSAGLFSPYSVVIVAAEGETIMTEKMFEHVAHISERIHKETSCRVESGSVVSPAYMSGNKINVLEAEALLEMARHWPCTDKTVPHWDHAGCSAAKEYEFLFEQSVNAERNAIIIEVTVPFFPFAKDSQPFIDKVYEIIDDAAESDKKLSFDQDWTGLFYVEDMLEAKEHDKSETHYLFCGAEVGYDAIMRKVYGLFPLMTGLTLGSVFVVLSIMLRSVFAPIRLALTLFLPLLAVYGAGVLVYQDGVLESLGSCFTPTGGFYWFIPILITSIVCGLALDYDVFLLTRIIEHRSSGYDIRASIVKATCETGGTIASAGIIMTLAFGGMLFANQSTMNLSGFILALAVLLDTFVVNTTLVPALMSLGDKVAWYPLKMPMENLITLDSPEFAGIQEYSSLNDGDSSASGSNSHGETQTSVSTN